MGVISRIHSTPTRRAVSRHTQEVQHNTSPNPPPRCRICRQEGPGTHTRMAELQSYSISRLLGKQQLCDSTQILHIRPVAWAGLAGVQEGGQGPIIKGWCIF